MHLNRALLGNTLYLAFIHGVVLVEVIGLLSVTPSARADPIVGHDLYTLTVPSGTTLFTFGSPSKPQFISNNNPMSSDHFVGYAGATTSTERALLWNGMGTPTSFARISRLRAATSSSATRAVLCDPCWRAASQRRMASSCAARSAAKPLFADTCGAPAVRSRRLCSVTQA